MVVPDSWSAVEFAEAELADERVRRNLCLVTGRLERRMGISFSAAAGHDGRQAIGRWQRRSKNTVDGTLAGHFAATLRRCEGYPMVLIAMDTTVVDYPGHWGKTGLGPIDSVGAVQGLLAHTALAMSTSGVPLGTLDLYLWARDPAKHGQKHQRRQRLPEEKESWRWPAQVQRVQERLNAMIEALFIADREGDYFGLFSVPRRAKVHLLIRVAQNRVVTVVAEALDEVDEALEAEHEAEREKLFEVAKAAPAVGRTQVKVWRQRDKKGKLTRLERIADVRVHCREVDIQPPKRLGAGTEPVRAWLVRSVEIDPPAGEEPVEWVLLTTRPVLDGKDAEQIVRWYALRWLLERLHYTLKSGCQIERLQILKREELEKVLALYWVVAWRVLWINYVARDRPDAPATEILTAEELRVLSTRLRCPLRTARDVTHALAKLAGAETWKSAPEPGVKRLWNGLRSLDSMIEYDRSLRDQDAKQG